MKKISIQPTIQSKNYVKSLWRLDFESLIHFILEIYENYKKRTTDLENIYLLLDEIGYQNLKDIPKTEMESIKALVKEKTPTWEIHKDSEFLTYSLLHAVQNQEIIIFIDDKIITDLNETIKLNENSIISFINNHKINQITFTTI